MWEGPTHSNTTWPLASSRVLIPTLFKLLTPFFLHPKNKYTVPFHSQVWTPLRIHPFASNQWNPLASVWYACKIFLWYYNTQGKISLSFTLRGNPWNYRTQENKDIITFSKSSKIIISLLYLGCKCTLKTTCKKGSDWDM